MLLTVAVVLATVGSGLLAGLFWTFSVAVMPALAREPGPAAAAVMQRFNLVIVRPAFLAVFLGTPVAAVVASVLAVLEGGSTVPWVVAGAVLHLLASVGLTAGYHVPRNDRLAAADPSSAAGQELWRTYLRDWTRANHARVAGCALATAAFAVALAVR